MKRSRLIVLVLVAGAIAVALFLWFGRRDSGPPSSLPASGTVEATEVHLGFPAGGRLASLTVNEGDPVLAGTQVATLEQAEQLARRRQAQAQAEQARSQLAELEKGSRPPEIRRAAAARDAAKASLEHARSELQTTRSLYEDRVVTRDAYDKAVLAYELAENQLAQAEEERKLVRSGPRSERIEAQRHQVELADAAVEVIDAALANTVIVAPMSGVVTTRHREPGEIVPPGTAVLTVMNPDDRWVRIYVAEDQIAAVRLGADVVLRNDTYPGARYRGKVTFIASEAEFTPKNVQTQEERVKLVYAVKVEIIGDAARDLKPGMPVDVMLDLGRPEVDPSRARVESVAR